MDRRRERLDQNRPDLPPPGRDNRICRTANICCGAGPLCYRIAEIVAIVFTVAVLLFLGYLMWRV